MPSPPELCCIKKPEALSFVEAAAIPETFFTVWHNVFERGGLKSGEKFLVHGGTSGIGVTAIQLAKAFGAYVLTTVGSDEKCEAARALGADVAINYRTQDFAKVIKTETGGRGVDVILDIVGGDYIEKNIRSLAEDGRLVNIGFQNGSTATIDFMRVMLKRLTITGSTLRIRSNEFKGHIARAIEEKRSSTHRCGQNQSADRRHVSPRSTRGRGPRSHGKQLSHRVSRSSCAAAAVAF